jgi:hypothetical protein
MIYYEIIVKHDQGNRKVRTKYNYLYHQEGIDLRILALGEKRKLLGEPTYRIIRLTKKVEENIKENIKEEKVLLTEEELREVKKIKKIKEERKEAFEINPYRNIAINVGLGSEKISANGGSSEFNSSANFWNFKLTFTSLFGKDKKNRDMELLINLDYHLYKTNHEEMIPETGVVASKSLELHRYFIDTLWQKRVYKINKYHHLWIGAGVGVSQFPMMETFSNQVGATVIGKKVYSGPLFSIKYLYKIKRNLHSLFQMEIVPMSFSSDFDVLLTSITSQLKYKMSENILGQISFLIREENVKYQLQCPSNDQSCKSNARTLNELYVFSLGGVFRF